MNYDPIKAARELLMSDPNVLESFKRAFVAAEPMCMCKDRLLSKCPGEWEPGCDLGNNEKFVVVSLERGSDRWKEIRDEERAAEIDQLRYERNHPENCDE